jgi:hypothetical protein
MTMAGITRKTFLDPETADDFGAHGTAAAVEIGEVPVWRSRLRPGWNWDEDVKPLTNGLQSCPLYHHEYVVSGTVRYLMDDGTELIAVADDTLFIEPGHRAWVIGEEECVLLDW